MACNRPFEAYQSAPGARLEFREHSGKDLAGSVSVMLPCRHCRGCRRDYKSQLSSRIADEWRLHDGVGMFVTLTFDDEHVPESGSCEKRIGQLFMHRLRKYAAAHGGKRVRFVMVGEYGGETFRPHYHALIMGFQFSDRQRLAKSAKGIRWRSAALESLWPFGHSEFDSISEGSICYVAGYALKKRYGDHAKTWYWRPHCVSGEVMMLEPEWMTCSRRPGLGAPWFDKFGEDDLRRFPGERRGAGGVRIPLARYYLNRLKQSNPDFYGELQELRGAQMSAAKRPDLPERQDAREVILEAEDRQADERRKL